MLRPSVQNVMIGFLYQVSIDIEGKNAWKQCFAAEGVHLPTGYYFGASAATGQLAGNVIYPTLDL